MKERYFDMKERVCAVMLIIVLLLSNLTVVAADEPVNLAAGKTAVGSSYVDDWAAPSSMIDGLFNTGYVANFTTVENTDYSVMVNLGDVYKVDEVLLYPWVEGGIVKGFPVNFEIRVGTGPSHDIDWKTVGTYWNYSIDKHETTYEAKQILKFEETQGQWVGIFATRLGKFDDLYGLGMYEMEIYNTRGQNEPIAQGAKEAVNVAKDAPVTAKDSINGSGFAKYYLNDGDVTTCYSSQESSTSLKIVSLEMDLEDSYDLQCVRLMPRDVGVDKGFPVNFKIDLWDGKKWVTVVDKTEYPNPEVEWQVFNFTRTAGSKIRIKTTKLSATPRGKDVFALQIAELEAYEYTMSARNNSEYTGGVKEEYNEVQKNVALNKSVYASDMVGEWGSPFFLTDNSFGTGFVSGFVEETENEKYFMVNLFDVYEVNKVVLYPWIEKGVLKGFPIDFEIRVGTGVVGNIQWKTVKKVQNYSVGTATKTEEAAQTFTFDSTQCQWIGIFASELGKCDDAYALMAYEMQVYGNGEKIKEGSGDNYCYRKPASASDSLEEFGFFQTFLTDGAVNSCYSSNEVGDENIPISIEIDLKEKTTLQSVRLMPRDVESGYNGFPVDFTISIWNGKKWVEVVNKTDYPVPTSEFQVFNFEATKGSKIKLNVTKLGATPSGNGVYALQLAEIEAYSVELDDSRNSEYLPQQEVKEETSTILEEPTKDFQGFDDSLPTVNKGENKGAYVWLVVGIVALAGTLAGITTLTILNIKRKQKANTNLL